MDDTTGHNDLSDAPRDEDGSDANKWRKCATLEEAGELMAQWLEGSSHYIPGYAAAQPDSETLPLRSILAKANRFGFLTEQSQPGVPIEEGCGQRAFVSGFCSEDVAGVLCDVLLRTELVVVVVPPGGSNDAQICVTIDDEKEFTWLGRATTEGMLELYREDANEVLADAISGCWELQIFDPIWGRKDRLWDCLEIALDATKVDID